MASAQYYQQWYYGDSTEEIFDLSLGASLPLRSWTTLWAANGLSMLAFLFTSSMTKWS